MEEGEREEGMDGGSKRSNDGERAKVMVRGRGRGMKLTSRKSKSEERSSLTFLESILSNIFHDRFLKMLSIKIDEFRIEY